jgi:hypothetical protein
MSDRLCCHQADITGMNLFVANYVRLPNCMPSQHGGPAEQPSSAHRVRWWVSSSAAAPLSIIIVIIIITTSKPFVFPRPQPPISEPFIHLIALIGLWALPTWPTPLPLIQKREPNDLLAQHNCVRRSQLTKNQILQTKTYKETPWPESASELYRSSDRRVSAKLVPTFCG